MHDDIQQQRDYYARTAEHYDTVHVFDDDQQGIAIAAFVGIARLKEAASILDVGAGTGRAVQKLRAVLPDARVVGVEPVRELREVGHRNGVSPDDLVDGDALALPFPDESFDFVMETAVLHHVPDPVKAVGEMLRLARKGVMISDSNKFGQGSPRMRLVKGAVRRLGLWRTMIRVQTRGKMSKWSEGDGVYYSYSVFDNLEQVRAKFPRVFLMNTGRLHGTDLRAGAEHVVLIALKN